MASTINYFKILNIIIQHYSKMPITASSLDNFLTVQIIGSLTIDVNELSISQAQKQFLYKFKSGNKRKNNRNKISNINIDNVLLDSTQNTSIKHINNYKNKTGTYYLQYQKQQSIHTSNKKYQKLQIQKSYNSHAYHCQQNHHYYQQQQQQQQNHDMIAQFTYQNSLNNNNNRKRQRQFTVFVIHQYYPNCPKLHNRIRKSVMCSIENIIIIDQIGKTYNNLLYFIKQDEDNQNNNTYRYVNSYNSQEGRILCILMPQTMNNTYDQWQMFIHQLQKQIEIYSIYNRHINLRLLCYPSINNSYLGQNQSSTAKLNYITSLCKYYRNSEDDLDVLIRSQIPADAYIKVIDSCAYKMTINEIRDETWDSTQQNYKKYTIIEHKQSYYTFYINRVFKDKNKHKNTHNTNVLFNSQTSSDELVIWVLVNGMAIMQMLPQVSKCLNKINKKYNYRARGYKGSKQCNKYSQHRSCLGYTHIVMDYKINSTQNSHERHIQTKKQQHNISNEIRNDNDSLVLQNQIDNDSLCCMNSQNTNKQNKSSTISNKQKQNQAQCQQLQQMHPCTFIVNITDSNIQRQQKQTIISQQISKIFELFLSQRKKVHQNIEVQAQLNAVERMGHLLGIDTQLISKIIITDKL